MNLSCEPTKALTIRLDAADYQSLEMEARRLGILPGTLGRVLIRTSLQQPHISTPSANLHLTPQVALNELAALRAQWPQHPPIDVVQIIAEGRAQNDERLTS